MNKWTRRIVLTSIVISLIVALVIGGALLQRVSSKEADIPYETPDLRANGNDYPAILANAPEDSVVDPWGFYNRECGSYVAWKVYETYHYFPKGYFHNAAADWINDAKVASIPLGSTPRVGSVAIFQPGWKGSDAYGTWTETSATGHAAWVQQVNNNGTMLVSQYSASDGQFTYEVYPVSGVQFIYFSQKA